MTIREIVSYLLLISFQVLEMKFEKLPHIENHVGILMVNIFLQKDYDILYIQVYGYDS